jgi:hypothetical protein
VAAADAEYRAALADLEEIEKGVRPSWAPSAEPDAAPEPAEADATTPEPAEPDVARPDPTVSDALEPDS